MLAKVDDGIGKCKGLVLNMVEGLPCFLIEVHCKRLEFWGYLTR